MLIPLLTAQKWRKRIIVVRAVVARPSFTIGFIYFLVRLMTWVSLIREKGGKWKSFLHGGIQPPGGVDGVGGVEVNRLEGAPRGRHCGQKLWIRNEIFTLIGDRTTFETFSSNLWQCFGVICDNSVMSFVTFCYVICDNASVSFVTILLCHLWQFSCVICDNSVMSFVTMLWCHLWQCFDVIFDNSVVSFVIMLWCHLWQFCYVMCDNALMSFVTMLLCHLW